MKKLSVLLLLVSAAGCKVVHTPAHPHVAPPGQVKKAVYRCGSCGVSKSAAGSCHGKPLIVVTP